MSEQWGWEPGSRAEAGQGAWAPGRHTEWEGARATVMAATNVPDARLLRSGGRGVTFSS